MDGTLRHHQQQQQQGGRGPTEEVETPHLDSFAVHLQDGTIIIGEKQKSSSSKANKKKKKKKARPQSTPYRLFEHYATVAANGGTTTTTTTTATTTTTITTATLEEEKKKKGGAAAGRWERPEGFPPRGVRPTWSARTTASSSAAGSHVSRCTVPGPHDILPGNKETLSGPHADISSLLGPPACPRDNVHPQVHHRSAFYHVPGRYATNVHSYPSRRCQKTEGARILQSVLAAKMAQAYRHHPQSHFRMISPSSAAPRALGVNQRDVSLLVRETSSVSKPDSRAHAILTSARQPAGHPQDLTKPYAAQAVTFSEPISVS